ncbi:MAG: circadian clock protein KaiC [Planctomycetes bacterium]|nr:circadian clock protein KaiC [Planctomycetota bacterium]
MDTPSEAPGDGAGVEGLHLQGRSAQETLGGVPEPGRPIEKVPTGIAGLDEVLLGGLPVGRTTLVGGGPGTGKTVLALEFLHRGALAGAPGVFVSFEERVNDLRANAGAMGMELSPLEAAGKLRLVHAAVPHDAVYAGQFDIQGLLAMLEGHTAAVGAGRLVIDAIDVLMRVFGDPDRERQELHILHQWLRDRGLTALLTAKAGGEGMRTYPFLDFMADCVLLLDQRIERQVRTRRLNVVKYRGSGFLSNEYPYVLSERGIVVMPISSASLRQAVVAERVSSGDAAFDALLGGGFQRGSCILLAGPSGAGKTTLAGIFVQAACRRGEGVLYVSFEEAATTLTGNLRSVGIDVQTPADAGMLQIVTALPEAMGVEQHLLRVYDAIESSDPRHIVIDAISACRRMGSEQAAFDFCARLVTTCKQRGITCLYTNQTSDPRDVVELTGLGLSSLVDTLIALPFHDDGQRLRRRMVVIKSRGSAHSTGYQDFAITDNGPVFGAGAVAGALQGEGGGR